MAEVFLSIGSNIEPDLNFKQCAIALESAFTELVWSPIYQSAAMGMEGDDFLNAVVLAHTEKSVDWVVQTTRQIEDMQGRVRGANKFISRTLDIDLLLYDNKIINTEITKLPHEEISNTFHVLVPLVDLAPSKVHPIIGKTYSTLLEELLNKQENTVYRY